MSGKNNRMRVKQPLKEKPPKKTVESDEEALLGNIIHGRTVVSDPEFTKSIVDIVHKIDKRLLYNEKTHLERVRMANKHYSKKKLVESLKTVDSLLKKDSTIAGNLIVKAFEYQENLKSDMSLRCVNLALMFGPKDFDLFSWLATNSPEFLERIGDWKSEVKNVDQALKCTQIRAEAQKTQLNSLELCEDEKFNAEVEKRRIYRENVIFKLHGNPNPKIPCGGNYLHIVPHHLKGRIVLVTEELPAGTTVIVENPFVSHLTNALRWEVKHCAMCYKKTHALIPCPNCVFTLYCSQECRMADYEATHKYECNCLSFLHAIDIPNTIILGFRAVCKVGPVHLFKLFEDSKSKDPKPDEPEIKGFDPQTGRYDSDSYHQVLNLAFHLDENRLASQIWLAFCLAQILDARTNFYVKIDKRIKSHFLEFVATYLLQHAVSFELNVMSIWKYGTPKETQKVVKTSLALEDKAAQLIGVYSLSSMMSHDCDPSAIRVNQLNGKMAIVTRRRLMPGDELTISYGQNFAIHRQTDRFHYLCNNFEFVCECLACDSDWPIVDEINPIIEYICPTCTGNFSYAEVVKNRKCVLNRVRQETDMAKCENCKAEVSLRDLEKQVDKYENILQRAMNLLNKNSQVDAIPLILESIEFFQKTIVPPSSHLVKAQLLLQSAYNYIGWNAGD